MGRIGFTTARQYISYSVKGAPKMTFELTPESKKDPKTLAAIAKAKAAEQRANNTLGYAVLIVGAVVLVGAVLGLKSCISSVGRSWSEHSERYDAEKAERVRQEIARNSSHAEPSDTLMISSARSAVIRKLLDDRSASFRDVVVITQESGSKAVCGQVNSKNRLGGYSGYQHFISAGSDEHTWLEEQVPDFANAWNRICTR